MAWVFCIAEWLGIWAIYTFEVWEGFLCDQVGLGKAWIRIGLRLGSGSSFGDFAACVLEGLTFFCLGDGMCVDV